MDEKGRTVPSFCVMVPLTVAASVCKYNIAVNSSSSGLYIRSGYREYSFQALSYITACQSNP
jgi:hypothetical protein